MEKIGRHLPSAGSLNVGQRVHGVVGNKLPSHHPRGVQSEVCEDFGTFVGGQKIAEFAGYSLSQTVAASVPRHDFHTGRAIPKMVAGGS